MILALFDVFLPASPPVSLSNFIAFDVFFFFSFFSISGFMKSGIVYAVILPRSVRLKTMISPTTELKRPLDIF